jgi:DNA-binding NarL/FixJ family response regulator
MPESAGTNVNEARVATPRPLRILIVDDNAEWALAVRRLLERRLPDSGREVRWEASMKKAKASLGEFNADVTLLDLHLPDSKPEETISAIRDFLPPVFVISGFDDDDDTLLYRCIEAGAANFYTKDELSINSLAKDIVVQCARIRFQGKNGISQRRSDDRERIEQHP